MVISYGQYTVSNTIYVKYISRTLKRVLGILGLESEMFTLLIPDSDIQR